MKFKIGTRHSKLALTQTNNALKELKHLFPAFEYETVHITTPGDKDRTTNLKSSVADFFTKTLDDAILTGRIDAAVHSAKDLPAPFPDGLDWFWLPWQEDPRDVLILPANATAPAEAIPAAERIGVSSHRREEYCRKRFPHAHLASIRGNIDERIQQLDAGKYDLLIMAAAGLNRLNLANRISEYIPLKELQPPAGQGCLAVTFKKGNVIFETIRKFCVKPVQFVGAGPGAPGLITQKGLDALKNCDICLYDALSPAELLHYLPTQALPIYVGKRAGKHSMKQVEICDLIADFSRQGKRVVRLKGGDPGIFGRLAEEIDTLNELDLPYFVVPGISSLAAATTGTGLLLTRREVSHGFTVMTPRKANSAGFEKLSPEERLALPSVFFMGISEMLNIAQQYLAEGKPPSTPVAIIYAAGSEQQEIVSTTLAELRTMNSHKGSKPGLLMIGENANSIFLYRQNGALAGNRILITCSNALQGKAAHEIHTFGGKPISRPLIKLVLEKSVINDISFDDHCYDYIAITSPSAVRCFMELVSQKKLDLRQFPKLAVCGPGTYNEFGKYSIYPDVFIEENFGSQGFVAAAESQFKKGDRLLRLRSDKASPAITESLIAMGLHVADRILYRNTMIDYDNMPEFDSVVLASSSAVHAFVKNWGHRVFNDKQIVVIGQPTAQALMNYCPDCHFLKASEATIENCIQTLAYNTLNTALESYIQHTVKKHNLSKHQQTSKSLMKQMSDNAIMVVGTTSNAGKSVVATALCRYFYRKGYRVAPYKAQNMALNSFVTEDGDEMGRAQVVQAKAAKTKPHTDMNPVLLKPLGKMGTQLIVNGKVVDNINAKDYYGKKSHIRYDAWHAFDRLAAQYDKVIMEGAGSPAEINILHNDFVNMPAADYAKAKTVLVADIDRGGVFASIYGTIKLIPEEYQYLIKGIIINKFRGDVTMLESGIADIEKLTGIPVLGVLPYADNLIIEEEDSLGLENKHTTIAHENQVDIAVIRLPFMSNYTDFLPLETMAEVNLRYVTKPQDMKGTDVIIIPGTKTTCADMKFLRESGFEVMIKAAVSNGTPIIGICGGFQMLGRKITDPHGFEGGIKTIKGLELLDIETELTQKKELTQVSGLLTEHFPFIDHTAQIPFKGYEIHAGHTSESLTNNAPLLITKCLGIKCNVPSGAVSVNKQIFGCYIHGLFDLPETCQAFVNYLLKKKGINAKVESVFNPDAVYEQLADMIETHIDMTVLE